MDIGSALFYAIALIVTLGVLITVHEFGHFWVARRLGVKVLRFSVGFGKPIWSWRSKSGETEYAIAALPLGGYVKMLDEREGEVAEAERDRAFNNKPVGTRIAVVAAGPVFNLLFAVLAFWVMFMIGVPGYKPLIGEVAPGTAVAEAGFQQEDLILRIKGREIPTWGVARLALLNGALGRERLEVEVKAADGQIQTRVIDFSGRQAPVEPDGVFEELGLRPWLPPPALGSPQSGSPAEQAGLQSGDRVVSVDGEPIQYWHEWVQVIRAHPGEPMEVTVKRDGASATQTLVPERRERSGEVYGYAGVGAADWVAERLRAVRRYGPLEGLGAGAQQTWEMSSLIVRVLAGIVFREASLGHISGPLTIAEFAGKTASGGFVPFLTFLAVVSISLGVLNLLPIPILDGGHLMYYLIELVKGSPVSEQAQAIGQRVGILLLLMLMGLAFYNDIIRLFY